MNRRLGLGLLLAVTVVALALRLPHLGHRPMHNDEATNAIRVGALWERGQYTYDPHEYHGPSLAYATLPFLWLGGASDFNHLRENTLRLVAVAFGVGLILVLPLARSGLGWGPTLCTAVFTAISPVMVFYSRYYIHEMLLTFFTALVIVAGWRYSQRPRLGWAVLVGLGLGLMYATKETFIIVVGAMGGALALTIAWNRLRPPVVEVVGVSENPALLSPNTLLHTLAALATAFVVSMLLFTSFFHNWSGPADSIRTYFTWSQRAAGASPHIHPWYFYLERLCWFHPSKSPIWSEGLIVALGLIGIIAALSGHRAAHGSIVFVRFLAFYTVLLTGAYSAISYKTPWCMLGFVQPLILLAGWGAGFLFAIVRGRASRLIFMVCLVGLCAQLGGQTYRGNFVLDSDMRNPCVYAQTSPNLLDLVERVRGISKVAPDEYQMVIKVISPESYWPLPWYFREFKQVGWWDELPPDPYAPVVVVSSSLHANLDDKSNKRWLMTGMYELRPHVFLELYVAFDLWAKYVATMPRRDSD